MKPKPRTPPTGAATATGALAPAPDSTIAYGAAPPPRKAGRPRGADTAALGLRVPLPVYELLTDVAKSTGITKRRLVTDALRDYLPRVRDKFNEDETSGN